ncbi:hypothetical protein GCM10028791_13130 [Echinicola sediminis]
MLYYYGLEIKESVVDSLAYTLLVFGGFLMLENIFRFYKPQRNNAWLILAFPLSLSVVLVFLGKVLLQYLLKADPGYVFFLMDSMVYRWVLIMLLLTAYVIVLLVGGELEDQLEARRREEMIAKLAKEAELYHLRQQLQPHFLFNSLNSISALVKKEPDRAREMVLQLSSFLRGTIRKDEKEWVTVEEEVGYLKLFLGIEKVRFGHRLVVKFEIDENTLGLKLPPLLIQPLLENAVKHGVYGVLDLVEIKVRVFRAHHYLEVMISNPFDRDSVSEEGKGFGLNSIKRRLFLLFGRNDLLTFDDSEDIFQVHLRIPVANGKDPNN